MIKTDSPLISIVMGSRSDWETMQHVKKIFVELNITYESRVISAHRTPERLYEYASKARNRGIKVIIAGAGGAAHLPGMCASMTTLPVLGVPVQSKALGGVDSLLSIVQMPKGVPVGTMAIGESGAFNAGLMAASIIALNDESVFERLSLWRKEQTELVPEKPEDN